MSAAPVKMKKVFLYKAFNNPDNAAREGYTIPVRETRGIKKAGQLRFGKEVQVPIVKKERKTLTGQQENELSSLLGGLGLGNSAGAAVAQAIAANPGQQIVEQIPAAGWGGEAGVAVDVDGLTDALGILGLKGGRKHKRKTHKRRRHSKRRHTRRR
jgi:hypothetical protein